LFSMFILFIFAWFICLSWITRTNTTATKHANICTVFFARVYFIRNLFWRCFDRFLSKFREIFIELLVLVLIRKGLWLSFKANIFILLSWTFRLRGHWTRTGDIWIGKCVRCFIHICIRGIRGSLLDGFTFFLRIRFKQFPSRSAIVLLLLLLLSFKSLNILLIFDTSSCLFA
jgi:hypothetical protein